MTTATHEETLGFQTEVKQLLHLMIHSLYSNREIFLRELISNAADACDKLRYAALDNDAIFEGDSDLRIEIEHDQDAGTITLRDNGIGMNRDEVIENLGTIARSGTSEFLKQLSGEQQKDAKLIGQFGVGFYSGFIVADDITVRTRKAGTDASDGVEWRSQARASSAWRISSSSAMAPRSYCTSRRMLANSPMTSGSRAWYASTPITSTCRCACPRSRRPTTKRATRSRQRDHDLGDRQRGHCTLGSAQVGDR